MTFYENFIRLCNDCGKSPSLVATEIGFEKSTVSRWKKGGNPTDASVDKVARYFGVKVEEIAPERQGEQTIRFHWSPEHARANRLMEVFYEFDDDEHDKVIALLEAYRRASNEIRHIVDTALEPYKEKTGTQAG